MSRGQIERALRRELIESAPEPSLSVTGARVEGGESAAWIVVEFSDSQRGGDYGARWRLRPEATDADLIASIARAYLVEHVLASEVDLPSEPMEADGRRWHNGGRIP